MISTRWRGKSVREALAVGPLKRLLLVLGKVSIAPCASAQREPTFGRLVNPSTRAPHPWTWPVQCLGQS